MTLVALRGHEGGVFDSQFLLDSKQIVKDSRDNTARMWNVATAFSGVFFTGSSKWPQVPYKVLFQIGGIRFGVGAQQADQPIIESA